MAHDIAIFVIVLIAAGGVGLAAWGIGGGSDDGYGPWG